MTSSFFSFKAPRGPVYLAVLTALGALAGTSALAQEQPWYIGVGAGQSKATFDQSRIANSLLGVGATPTSMTETNRSTNYKLFGGYQMNRYWGVEAGYFDLGRFDFNAQTAPPGSLAGEIKLRGLNLDLVGRMPFTKRCAVFGRVGAHHAEARDAFSGTGAVYVTNPNPSKTDRHSKVGVGLEYSLTNALALRGEVERYRVNDAVGNTGDIDTASIALVYRFGGKTPAPAPRMVAAPEPVMAPPPPPPPVVIAPPPPPPPVVAPMPTKVSLSADALFGFDSASIKPEGQQLLNKMASDLSGVQYDVITVTGHTDRIGSKAYNQKLSARRAEAVSRHLVDVAGIRAGKITTRGVGSDNPETAANACPGKKTTPALIACLQADRRVDVEVSGTRAAKAN